MVTRRKGFTMVELGIVVAVVLVLIVVLLLGPSIWQRGSRDPARRSACAANLHSMGRSLHMYAMKYDAKLPSLGTVGGRWDGIGQARDKRIPGDLPRAANQTNSRDLWLLLHMDPEPGNFLCPSLRDTAPSEIHDGAGNKYYDFRDQNALSYSYQVQRGSKESYAVSLELDADMAVVADRSPVVASWKPDAGGVRAVLDNSRKVLNSPNHGARQSGQNVLFLGGDVLFFKTCLAGIDDDNIWTPNGGKAGAPGDNLDGRNVPHDKTDSFLAP